MRKPTFWFLTWSDTNQAVQPQKMARGLKFRFYKEEGFYNVAKAKALISFAVTAKLICVFVFPYAKCWFSHTAAHLVICLLVTKTISHFGFDDRIFVLIVSVPCLNIFFHLNICKEFTFSVYSRRCHGTTSTR